jgi:hypothetical protein
MVGCSEAINIYFRLQDEALIASGRFLERSSKGVMYQYHYLFPVSF